MRQEIARLKRIIEDYDPVFDRLKAADKAVAPLLEAGPGLLEACEHARSELRHTRFEVKAYPGLRAVADMLGPDEDAANAWLLEPPPYNLKKREAEEGMATIRAEVVKLANA